MSRGPRPLRERVREVMEPYRGGPEASRLSLVVDLVVLAAIAASCALVVAEGVHPELAADLGRLELALTVGFVLEYLLRWYGADNRWRYPFTALAALDLVAILPGLLTLGTDLLLLRSVRGVRLLRLLRLLRLVRLLRILRYGHLIHRSLVLARVRAQSLVYQYRLGPIGRLFLGWLVAVFIGANLLNLTEASLDDASGPFDGYWRSYWSVLVVLVSGLEDKEPLTLLGRLEVAALLIVGLVVVGMLTAEIVAALVRRGQRAGKVALKPPASVLSGHIVILGANRHVDAVIRQVHAALHGRHHILVVAPDAGQLPATDRAVYRKVFALEGDPCDTRTLELADLERAARVVVLAGANGDGEPVSDSPTLMATLAVVGRWPGVPVTVELGEPDSLRYTHVLGRLDLVLGRRFAERMTAQAVLNPGITSTFTELMTFTDDSNEIYGVAPPPEVVGLTFAEAQRHYHQRDDLEAVLIGVDRGGGQRFGSEAELAPVAAGERRIGRDDRLIVLAYHQPGLGTAADPWRTTSLVRE